MVLTCPIIENTAAKNSATKKSTIKNKVTENLLQACFQCLLVSQVSHHATAYFAYLYPLLVLA